MKDLSAVILAGGQSSRMGQDKGLMQYKGVPMVQHIIQAVQPITNRIHVITANTAYQKFGYPVFPDKIPNKGPLGGIVTGLLKCETDRTIILTCDTPQIRTDDLKELMEAADAHEVCIPVQSGRIHPLTGIYRRSALNHLKEQLALNVLKMTTALTGLDVQHFNADHWPKEVLKNINSKADLS